MIELGQLQAQVRLLVEDLRGQVGRLGELRSDLREEHRRATNNDRVGVPFETWLEGQLDQAAVAWMLGCVFVRFCEDNRLVKPLWIGGADEDAPADRALRERQAFLMAHPEKNDRDWLRRAFKYLGELRPSEKIFDQHNLVWRFPISGEAAEALSEFFRKGAGAVSLRTPTLDTRFLGDLYQDLSAYARSTYALLQTPVFVEEFILDRTLEPAIAGFGLPGTSMIDPTCGSGHFLLGAFDRLMRKWRDREPAGDIRELTQRALHQVTGVDINAFAVAIARFRLMIAALKACDLDSLERAPKFELRVATGDSLLNWGEQSSHQTDLLAELEGRSTVPYYSEDADLLAEYLKTGQYTVVVGNPPYITVKDKALNDLYRQMYSACSGKYALTVPFAQRFFALARRGDHDGDGAGLVGQITANSFMKREFGKKLINEYFAHEVELNEVIDASGSFIPAHGTPTVILVGRNRIVSPRYSGTIRTLLSVRGEPGQPADPAHGVVWSAITEQIDDPGSDSDWITSIDTFRERLVIHPWSLSGGGAGALMDALDAGVTPLRLRTNRIGVFGITGSDDVMLADVGAWRRTVGDHSPIRQLVVGDELRDWVMHTGEWAFFPYDHDLTLIDPPQGRVLQRLWPYRTVMGNRATFSKATYFAEGRPWYEWHQITGDPGAHKWWIAFAFVATHNHFVLDRVGKVFKQSAPVIKLPAAATEDDHLRLLGVLNSSTASFWLKQVSQPKGGTANSSGGGNRWSPEPWYERYEFTGTKLQSFPLPSTYPLVLARALDDLAQRLSSQSPSAIAAEAAPARDRLVAARLEWESIRARMIACQEELDWQVYSLYGLLDDDLTAPPDVVPELRFGERAFEIVLARKVAAGRTQTEWFARHHSTPVTDLPPQWPAAYREVVRRRIEVIESNRNIQLIERPEHKRRWATDGWDKMQAEALRDWLLDRLEAQAVWGDTLAPLSVAQIADRVRHDEDFRQVLDLWVGHDQHDLVEALTTLTADEHIPYLPADRYKPSGLRKRAQWERTWRQQRAEDAAAARGDETGAKRIRDAIAVPPRYSSADFVRHVYSRHRGKLDVPKERFISYSNLGRDGDTTALLGWAGWNHLDQARALAALYLDRKTQAGWKADRLLPMLAGLAELEPWLHQWHHDPQLGYPSNPADFFTGLIDTELAALGRDRTELTRLRGVEELS